MTQRMPESAKRTGAVIKPRATFFLVLALLVALLGASSLAVSGAPASGAGLAGDVELSAYPPYSDNWRIGFGFDQTGGQSLDQYDVSQLCAGWYQDWGSHAMPQRPGGIDFVQTLRVSENHFNLYSPETYNWDGLDAKIAANPGGMWIIGNEPDGVAVGACDNRTPTEYAQIYNIFYEHIKETDPTAQVLNGPIIQGTVLRMQWLTKTWDAYQQLYGEDWPVDIWAMHNQMVTEAPYEGADIPPGCDPALGTVIGVQDNDNLDLFIEYVERMRQWMKDHGQQSKALYITEYGVLQPEVEGFTVDRINLFMTRTFTYLLNATDSSLGMPADGNRLVQRWNWFALNTPLGHLGTEGAWNGNLFDPDTKEITEFGRNFAEFACGSHPTPTPNSYPASRIDVREAEGGSIHGLMGTDTKNSASECRYVVKTDGGSSTSETTDVTYHFYARNTGDYVLWVRGQGVDYNNKSVSVKVGAYDWNSELRFVEGAWSWKRISGTYYLEGSRWHKVQVGPRMEGTTQVDMLVLTDLASYDPSTDPDLVQPCEPTKTSTPTITSTPLPTSTPTISRTPMPTGPAGISGQVAYQGRGSSPADNWARSLLVTAHLPGDPVPAYEFDVDSDTQGNFTVTSGVQVGTYDVGVRNLHSLRNLRSNVLLDGNTQAIDMGTLDEGDANIDNAVNILDFSLFSNAYATQDLGADFNEDGAVNIVDFSLLAGNFGKEGDSPAAAGQLNSTGLDQTVTVSIVPSSKTVSLGEQFTVDLYAYAGSTLFDGVECRIYFDPAYLDAIAITPGTALEMPLAADIYSNYFRFARGTLTPKSGTIHLCTLTLEAKANVTSTFLDIQNLIVSYGISGAVSSSASDGTVYIPFDTPTPTPTLTLTPTNTPTITPTSVHTTVPEPTATDPADPGQIEVVFRQGLNGYSSFLDTFISDWEPETNYEGQWHLKLRSLDVRRILIHTDVSTLPAGITIDEAVLTLYQFSGSNNPIESQLYGVTRDWDVDETTWISATTPSLWAQEGCDEPDIDRDAAETSSRTVFPTHHTFTAYPFDFDVTSLVQRWVDNPVDNHGLMINSVLGPSAEFNFAASENPDEEIRPRLMVRYHVGGAYTATPTTTGTPSTATPTATVDLTPSATPAPTTSTLSAIKDTYINDWDRDANFGGHDSILIRSNGVQKGLVQFGLTGITPGSMVFSAKLRLYNLTQMNPEISISAYGLMREWGEFQSTWFNATDGVAWTEYGAASVVSDHDQVAQDTIDVTLRDWYEWDVTELVQRWVQNPSSNYGILLEGNPGVSTNYNFASREYGVTSQHPQLVVDWQYIPPTATPTPTATATFTPEPKSVIQGHVYIDKNDNGSYDDGEGMSGGTVEIRRSSPYYFDDQICAADGSYHFDDLDSGTFELSLAVAPFGYVWPDAASPYVIAVAPGDEVDVDFMVIDAPDEVYLPMILSE